MEATPMPVPCTDPRLEDWSQAGELDRFAAPGWARMFGECLNTIPPEEAAELLRIHCWKVVRRLKCLETELRRRFVDKDAIIRMAIVCAMAQQPMLLIGKPGTAKSKIITRLCEGLGIQRAAGDAATLTVFQYLLHAFTEPDELLGVVDLRELQKNSKFKRIRKGSLTEATFVFLDEVFKANSAILNTLLSIINERCVYEGGESHEARCRQVYGASNDVPAGRQMEELRAFYERFVIRMESQEVKGRDKTEDLLRRAWAGQVDDMRADYQPQAAAMPAVSCLNDLLFCHRAAGELWGGPALDNPGVLTLVPHFHDLVELLRRTDPPVCVIDDRKLVRLFLLVRVHALLPHQEPDDWESWIPPAPQRSDLVVFSHIWDDPVNRSRLEEIVKRFIAQG